MENAKDKTCAELVYSKMMEVNEQLENLNDIIADNMSDIEETEQALEELSNFALEFTSYKVIKILLSTGGPADWVEVEVDDDGHIMRMSYHYADWFDHAETSVSSNSYIWDYASEIAKSFTE
jgi:hypothetical protein